MKDKKMLYGIALAFIFLASVGFSYAYFTASIANKDVKDQVVTTGTLELTYTDGPEIIMNNIKPGATITKEVSVKNTGTLDTSYNLVWQELANEIINDEMVIEATCTRLNSNGVEDGTCEGLTETPIKKIRIKENVSIEPSITHKYNVTITFKEKNEDQNYNQGKSFSGVLGVKEYKVPKTVYCTFDGEMVQGAEFVNGQYTYRYMQEGTVGYHEIIGYTLQWHDITEDGWGVTVSDTMNYEHITSEMCTFINDKPVVSMAYMFGTSSAKSIDLDSFDTSNVKNMFGMFFISEATTLDLSNFDTSKVTNMSDMFSESQATTIDVSNFDTSNVTDMNYMFFESQATTLDLSNFDTSKVTDMNNMFHNSQATTIDVSNFDTSKVTNMFLMFYGSKTTTLDLSSFNTSKVTDMSFMFAFSQATTLDLSNFDTSNVIDMNDMFNSSQATTLDVSNFDTSNVTNMNYMFYESDSLKSIYASSKFNTSNVTDGFQMFYDCTSLVGGAGTIYDSTKTDKTYARIDGGTANPGYFTLKTN